MTKDPLVSEHLKASSDYKDAIERMLADRRLAAYPFSWLDEWAREYYDMEPNPEL